MNTKLKAKLSVIEQRLLRDDITAFKIGKTENEDERFHDDVYNAYDYASIIAYSDDPTLIANAESDLIQYLKSHPVLKGKCENINNGSTGNPYANKLYIVAIGESPRKGLETLLDKFPLSEDLKISI